MIRANIGTARNNGPITLRGNFLMGDVCFIWQEYEAAIENGMDLCVAIVFFTLNTRMNNADTSGG
jgi:hypothetical protein